MHPVNTRLAERLEEDVRRVIEDLDELAQDTLDTTRPRRVGVTSASWSQELPVPAPSRVDVPVFHPECEDESVGGGRQLDTHPADPGLRWRHLTP
jgi:hypothetical protein